MDEPWPHPSTEVFTTLAQHIYDTGEHGFVRSLDEEEEKLSPAEFEALWLERRPNGGWRSGSGARSRGSLATKS